MQITVPNSGYKHIILEAPTGFGKSHVAVVIEADAAKIWKGKKTGNIGSQSRLPWEESVCFSSSTKGSTVAIVLTLFTLSFRSIKNTDVRATVTFDDLKEITRAT
ncbi:MAG TPA: hypothetical protein VE130_15855 [Nitrososphaeraceae archaeon]|nr:hypothetical protein [Nitrososphaeraceae archaeon]